MKTQNLHFPYLPERLHRLGDLAYNLWFSWHSQPLWIFENLDTKLWADVYHNPVRLLHEIDHLRLDEVATQSTFIDKYDSIVSFLDHYLANTDTWFNHNYPSHKNLRIAYFSMEFGIHECLPIYSGGLGILAGDHLKSASDLGIPLIGVGLLYRESYFTQYISIHGHQQVLYIRNDFSTMAVQPVLADDNKELIIRIKLDHRTVAAKVWQVQIGRIILYLLDTDFSGNPPEDREITERLYVDDRDRRLLQEMLLGIGGVTALKAMGYEPSVWHMNEGHCSFVGIERIRLLLQQGHSLDDAIEQVRASTVFTTHTPELAGNEMFESERIDRYLTSYWSSMGLSREQFYALAQEQGPHDPNAFNMTILAIRLSHYINGVSKLHGEVARRMWHALWPELQEDDVPISSITNGIHVRTWLANRMKNLFDRSLDPQWRYKFSDKETWKGVTAIPDGELWKTHQDMKLDLIKSVRKRLAAQRERNGESKEAIAEAENILDPNILTIGFARRFAQYKRATLIFRDRERLKRILFRDNLGVQIIFAGKSHPANQEGKMLIQQIYGESRNPEFGRRVVFVENYDMSFARRLVAGVDVWLNTPRRPHEASGTSGMKAGINGVLNLSVLDGWWQEGYRGNNGWAIGSDRTYYHDMEQDENDSQSFYYLLEQVVIPLFYDRNAKGLPKSWIKLMKKAIQTIILQFNTYRMLQEYLTEMYLPAIDNTTTEA